MIDLSVKLLCTSKSGTLSRLIRQLKLLGWRYHSHDIEIDEKFSEITINCTAGIALKETNLTLALMQLSEVVNVLDVTFNGNRQKKQIPSDKEPKPIAPNKLQSNFEITPKVIKLTERRLTKIVGSNASFLVEQARMSSQNVGELYSHLAKALNVDERAVFLSIIIQE